MSLSAGSTNAHGWTRSAGEAGRCWMLDAGCWVLDAGFWVLDAGCWVLDAGFWILDGEERERSHHLASCILHPASSFLAFGATQPGRTCHRTPAARRESATGEIGSPAKTTTYSSPCRRNSSPTAASSVSYAPVLSGTRLQNRTVFILHSYAWRFSTLFNLHRTGDIPQGGTGAGYYMSASPVVAAVSAASSLPHTGEDAGYYMSAFPCSSRRVGGIFLPLSPSLAENLLCGKSRDVL